MRIDGETQQDSSTKNLVMKAERIIYTLSKVMTRESGDFIFTSTHAKRDHLVTFIASEIPTAQRYRRSGNRKAWRDKE